MSSFLQNLVISDTLGSIFILNKRWYQFPNRHVSQILRNLTVEYLNLMLFFYSICSYKLVSVPVCTWFATCATQRDEANVTADQNQD